VDPPERKLHNDQLQVEAGSQATSPGAIDLFARTRLIGTKGMVKPSSSQTHLTTAMPMGLQ
jgi:hypothetical protein